MGEVTTIIGGYVTEKIFDRVVNKFKSDVIEKWTKKRAQIFFEAFCNEVKWEEFNNAKTSNVDIMLDMVFENEDRSEALYNAYRSVCFTKSKLIGPRIIGLLTAEIINEKRDITVWEEKMYSASEILYDHEFEEFWNYTAGAHVIGYGDPENQKDLPSSSYNQSGDIEIKLMVEQVDSNWPNRHEISVGPLNLEHLLGSWAVKLKNLGIIEDDIRERQWNYKEDSERRIDQDGTVREIAWYITISQNYLKLVGLIERASPQSTSEHYGFSYLDPE